MSVRFRRLLVAVLFSTAIATSTLPATAAPHRDRDRAFEPPDIPSFVRRIIARIRHYVPGANEDTMSWPKP